MPAQRELLDVFTCVRNHVTLADAGRLLERNSERHVKPPAEMARLFADLPEAIANTRGNFLAPGVHAGRSGLRVPALSRAGGRDQISFLRQRAEEGARLRYQPYHERARRQIERELALIEKLELAGLFPDRLGHRPLLPRARNSGAGPRIGRQQRGLLCARITAVDPVGMDLLFERFLSEERGEWPDIDIDLPSGDKRERAIQYVYQRYGKLGAAMTANVITYRGRSAAREVGKALGFEITTLEKLIQPGARVGMERSEGDYRAPVPRGRVRPHASARAQIFRAVPHGAGPAAPSRASTRAAW